MSDTEHATVPVAVLGSGNIGTDLMIKIMRLSPTLRMAAMAGIDADSDGLARARRLNVPTTSEGIDGLLRMPEFDAVRCIFDATSAKAHQRHADVAAEHGKVMIDLTPAAVGPYVVPPVNLDALSDTDNVNMVTCGGQATIPIVAAISRVLPVAYAEIIASISSRSAGPGTRANIDEFTATTTAAICHVGRAERGKAIIVLNPADPPIIMRDTVYCILEKVLTEAETDAVAASVTQMVATVSEYVPGYQLKHDVQFDRVTDVLVPALERRVTGTRVTVLLQVRGAAHYLPDYAGNLDIMTSAALRTAERISELRGWARR
ncbi:acetaldehyde dehydrogenase (acetylating) [Mycolicibacterium goodii]|uniref:Acetaldehyde dehydrogenase n=1 Tax=Mycolicibacterium goodii TaxID=134601 RepID=A0A0K0WZA8_MYCGD|nr:acetaldehyde dehydrogenase [Mycolicibacterium goodii]